MTIAALAWFNAVICVIIFVTLWFIVCFKVLSVKRNSLDAITDQIHMHRRLHMQERGGENDAAAQNILEHKLMVYREVEKEYNALLKRPMNRIPSYIMGFHSKRKEKEI